MKKEYEKPFVAVMHLALFDYIATSIKIVDDDEELDGDEILSKDYDDYWE